jgi:COMPASS component BRE2
MLHLDRPANEQARCVAVGLQRDRLRTLSGFRYLPCGPSPNTSPSPLHPFYRTIPYITPTPLVHLSWLDRSPFLRLSPSAMACTTDKGYRSVRANMSARQGAYYFECRMLRSEESGSAHVRVGWARREAALNAPVGFDAYSYGIRDVTGEKVTISRPKPYGRSFSTGDVVGCLISLPNRPELDDDAHGVQRVRKPFRYKGQLYHEMTEYTASREMDALIDREGKGQVAPVPDPAVTASPAKPSKPSGSTTKNVPKARGGKKEAVPAAPVSRPLPRLEGSTVSFFLNGQPLGHAFENIYDFLPLPPVPLPKGKRATAAESKENTSDDGTLGYYPMVSCFGRGKVEFNFGPHWSAPVADDAWGLPDGAKPKAMADRWHEFQIEEAVRDERDEATLAVQIRAEMERVAKDGLDLTSGKAPKGKRGAAKPKKQTKRSLLVVEERGTPAGTPGPDERSSHNGTPIPFTYPPRDHRASSESTSIGIRPSSPVAPDLIATGDPAGADAGDLDAEGEEVDGDGMEVY